MVKKTLVHAKSPTKGGAFLTLCIDFYLFIDITFFSLRLMAGKLITPFILEMDTPEVVG